MKDLDCQWISSKDTWFVCATNPDGQGGGVLASFNVWNDALKLKIEAIKQGYTRVEIMTWSELNEGL